MKKKFKSLVPWYLRQKSRLWFWYWWNFKATEREKVNWDMFLYGTGVMKGDKRVDPRSLRIEKLLTNPHPCAAEKALKNM